MNLLGLLVDKGVLSASNRAKVEAELAKERPLSETLAEQGISLADALKVAGDAYGLPTRILGDPPANEEVFSYIPIDSARHYGFVPLDIVDGALEVGITDPDNIEALDALQFISGKIGMPYKIFLITKEDFDRVLDAYKNLSGEVGKALSEYETVAKPTDGKRPSASTLIPTEGPLALGDETLNLSGPHETLKEDAPVTKIVSTILRYAIEGHSSDMHIEPSSTKTRVRFRMDGELHTSLELPAKVHEAVVARIKILAKLRLDEKRKPQDGRFSATVEKRRIDFRVSTFPTEYGEKVEMRILDQSATTTTLESVGLQRRATCRGSRNDESARTASFSSPGRPVRENPRPSSRCSPRPTARNTMSCRSKTRLNTRFPASRRAKYGPRSATTFANGLRSILRQDPDIIMVGEIRDKETAVLAVQAALTGHLVFSTIHTNTAAGAIPRLIDMGVDPFLIAPTLVAVIGQRLVRKLCPRAAESRFPITDSIKIFLDREFADLPEGISKRISAVQRVLSCRPD